MYFLLYHSASQHYPNFKLPMILATKWIEVTWPSTILQYHSEVAQRFGEFLQNWFPYPRFCIPHVRRSQRFRYKKPRGSAPKSLEGRPPAWPKYHLENLQTNPENHLAKKSHKPQSLPARPARRTSRNDRWISTKNLDDRPNFWSFTFAKDSSNLICKKPPASPRTSCGYLQRGKLLPMQRFFDSLRIETQRGISFEAQTALDAPNLIA